MAIGSTKKSGIKIGTAQVVLQGSALGTWVQANDDAVATAATSAMQYNPSTVTSSNFHWIQIPAGVTRVYLQARCPKAVTTIGTNPIVKVYGGWITGADSTDAASVSAGEVRYMRIDSAAVADTGTTIAWPSTSPSTTNTVNDSVYWYSTPPTQTGFDTLGAEFIGVMVTTAAGATSGGSDRTMPVDILFTN